MLWVNGHWKYFYSYSASIDFSRQNLTTKVYPRTVRVKVVVTSMAVFSLFNLSLKQKK